MPPRVISFRGPVHGVVSLPGCKSFTNRALLCAALAPGQSRLRGISLSSDSQRMIALLTSCGIAIESLGQDLLVAGRVGGPSLCGEVFDVVDAGTVLRFLLPYVASGQGDSFWTGSERMRRRPIESLLKSLESQGCRFSFSKTPYRLPFTMHTHGLEGGEMASPGDWSSQFSSGLMLSAPAMRKSLRLLSPENSQRSAPYLSMTQEVQAAFGLSTFTQERHFVCEGKYRPCEYSIPGDSSAAFWFLVAVALSGGELTLQNLGPGNVCETLAGLALGEELGFQASWHDKGTLKVKRQLGRPFSRSFAAIPDLVPAAVVAALFLQGTSTILDVAHLRWKESDRLTALVEELARCGARIEANEDSLRVQGGAPLHGATLDPHNDHRLVAAFSLLGLRVPGISLHEDRSIAKSYPRFFEDFEGLFDNRSSLSG